MQLLCSRVHAAGNYLPTGRSHRKPAGTQSSGLHRRITIACRMSSGGVYHEDKKTNKKVVICGGGIIGASVVFYLAERGMAATIVEREGIACAASGKAGGFLALNWNDGSPVQELARLSFKLHGDLAEKFGPERIGYRAVKTLQVTAASQNLHREVSRSPVGKAVVPSWVDGQLLRAQELGDESTTAQVHPRLLTQALVDSATERGASVVTGTVQGLTFQPDSEGGAVRGVVVDGQVIEADAVVLAMGPWTSTASKWLRGKIDLGITGLKYHSIIVRPDEPVTAHCIEGQVLSASGHAEETEAYPRPDGTVYVCGQPQQLAVPESPAKVTVEPALIEKVRYAAGRLSSRLGVGASALEVEQACYLPIPPDGRPVIGQMQGSPGVYIAAGHSCWGILNGPATGQVIAELIVDGHVSCLPEGLGMLASERLSSR